MSVTEILEELPQLSSKDQTLVRDFLEELQFGVIEETPEMLMAVDEGLYSLEHQASIPLEVVRNQLQEKWATL